jgi:hypothetical protein
MPFAVISEAMIIFKALKVRDRNNISAKHQTDGTSRESQFMTGTIITSGLRYTKSITSLEVCQTRSNGHWTGRFQHVCPVTSDTEVHRSSQQTRQPDVVALIWPLEPQYNDKLQSWESLFDRFHSQEFNFEKLSYTEITNSLAALENLCDGENINMAGENITENSKTST